MTDFEFCVEYLRNANGIRGEIGVSGFNALRALMNVTMPENLSDEFFERQDRVLQQELAKKQVTAAEDIPLVKDKVSLFKGDITTIRADAIVNACNSQLLGCFQPLHMCIDNAIHTFAGLQMRRDLMKVMREQGHAEPNGRCKVTAGYNLPAKYVFHTVGPIYNHTRQNAVDLTDCYLSCLKKADETALKTIVFCSLSTGVFGYPIEDASKIAINTVKNYLENENKHIEKVIFNVFSDRDYEVYDRNIERIYR